MTWTEGSTTTKDVWTEIWGDGEDTTVKDGAAIVLYHKIKTQSYTKHISLKLI